MARWLLKAKPMRLVSTSLAVLISGLLLSPRAGAEMVEVPLRELTSLVRITFVVPRGECTPRVGPDARSLWLTCPEVGEDLERVVGDVLRQSPVKAAVHRSRLRGVALELWLESPLAGYTLSQSNRRVTLDVGRRSSRIDLEHLAEEVRWPLAEESDHEIFRTIDGLIAEGRLAAASEVMDKAPREVHTEMFHLRRADLIHLKGDLERAQSAYKSVSGRFRHRPSGLLARVRQAELEALRPAQRDREPDLPALDFLGQNPRRAKTIAWLGVAQLAVFYGDYEEAIRIARVLTEGGGGGAEVASRGKVILERSVAALVLEAVRSKNVEKIAEVALAHRGELIDHPDGDLLAPFVSDALMRFDLPEQAAAVLQAVVGRSDSDDLVLEWAEDMGRAYLEAGKVYRASQVVDYALALSRGDSKVLPTLYELRAEASLREERYREAWTALSGVESVAPAILLKVAEGLVRVGAGAEALEALGRLGQLDASQRQASALALAEAKALTGAPDAAAAFDEVLERDLEASLRARLGYLRASLLASSEPSRAGEAFRSIEGDPRWERLGRVASDELSIVARLEPPAPVSEIVAPPPEEASEPRPRPRRRRRRRARTQEINPAPSAAEAVQQTGSES